MQCRCPRFRMKLYIFLSIIVVIALGVLIAIGPLRASQSTLTAKIYTPLALPRAAAQHRIILQTGMTFLMRGVLKRSFPTQTGTKTEIVYTLFDTTLGGGGLLVGDGTMNGTNGLISMVRMLRRIPLVDGLLPASAGYPLTGKLALYRVEYFGCPASLACPPGRMWQLRS